MVYRLFVSQRRLTQQWCLYGEADLSLAGIFYESLFYVTLYVGTTRLIVAEEKQRMIQEYVPGKQLTLAHLIANPQGAICQSLGLDEKTTGALGILTITPGEAAIIAADVATKAADIEIGFLDRFGGAVVLVGDVASVEAAISDVLEMFQTVLHFATTEMTRS